MDIAVIGSNMVDLITYTNQMPKEGETLEAPAFKIGCGGKGANQAVAAAKLNSKVLMLTKVGDDILRIILFVISNHGELIPLMLRKSLYQQWCCTDLC